VVVENIQSNPIEIKSEEYSITRDQEKSV